MSDDQGPISTICALCFKSDCSMKCGGCSKVFYCSSECQRSHWKVHKPTCLLIRSTKPPSDPSSSSSSTPSSETIPLVATFNSLPRSPLIVSGIGPNHWCISLRHVPLNPPSDLLFLFNPASGYMHTEGPLPLLSLPSIAHQAKAVVPLLLKSFNNKMGIDKTPLSQEEKRKTALYGPWSWSADDEELARELGKELRRMGVLEELCEVRVSDREEKKVADATWKKYFLLLRSTVNR